MSHTNIITPMPDEPHFNLLGLVPFFGLITICIVIIRNLYNLAIIVDKNSMEQIRVVEEEEEWEEEAVIAEEHISDAEDPTPRESIANNLIIEDSIQDDKDQKIYNITRSLYTVIDALAVSATKEDIRAIHQRLDALERVRVESNMLRRRHVR